MNISGTDGVRGSPSGWDPNDGRTRRKSVEKAGGAAYAPYGSPSQAAGVIGLGTAVPLTSHLHADLGITTVFYSFDLKDSTATSIEHGFQVDPLVHAGVSWSWP